MPKKLISMCVNHCQHEIEVWPLQRLLDVLREDLRLTGAKQGCGEGECGACSIFMNGRLVNSCLIPAAQANGAQITTIEQFAQEEQWRRLLDSMVDQGGTQCGFCTPGIVMAAIDLLRRNSNPTESDVRSHLSGNICRCTGYQRILQSVLRSCQPRDAIQTQT